MEMMCKNVMNLLEANDTPLLRHIKSLSDSACKLCFIWFKIISFKLIHYNILASPGIEEITFQTAFKSLCAPMLRNLFSGYLSLSPLMFVWDQYVISGDVPGYHEDLLPIIAAIIFMILRDQLMAVESVSYFLSLKMWFFYFI